MAGRWLTQTCPKRHNRLHRHPLRALQPARRRQQHLPEQRCARAGRAQHLHRWSARPHAGGDAVGPEYAAEAEGCRRVHPGTWIGVRGSVPVSHLPSALFTFLAPVALCTVVGIAQ